MNYFFNNLRESCVNRRIPLISQSTENFLVNIITQNKPKKCLEIWSAVWYSGILIAETIQNRGWQINSFEICFPNYKECLYNLHISGQKNCSFMHADFAKVALKNYFTEQFDFVFIDARKADYRKYLELVQPMLARNCVIILDDVIKYANKSISLYENLKKLQVFYKIDQIDEDDWVMTIIFDEENQKKFRWTEIWKIN